MVLLLSLLLSPLCRRYCTLISTGACPICAAAVLLLLLGLLLFGNSYS